MGFTVPAGTSAQLASVTLSLARTNPATEAYANVNLYTDNGSKPGSYRATLGSVDPLTGSFEPFTMAGSWALTGGTTYWVVVDGTNTRLQQADNVPGGQFTNVGTRVEYNYTGWLDLNVPLVITLRDNAPDPVTVNSITRAGASPTNAASVGWLVEFSGLVSSLSTSDFALAQSGVSGASITDVSGSGSAWAVTASTGSGDGTLGLNMTSGAGVTGLPFTGEIYTIDKSPPTVVVSSTASDPTGTSPVPVKVIFSEPVTGFEASDVVIGNGSLTNFAGSGANYTFDLTPASQGAVTVDLAADVATDAAGNGNDAATQFSVTYDSLPPAVSIGSTAANPTNISPFLVTVTFSEEVTGFDSADVTVGNGSVRNFTGAGALYTFDVAPGTQGVVTVDIAADVAADAAQNGNSAATQFSITVDSAGPTVTISSTASNPTGAWPIPVSVSFSEPVTDFDVSDINVTNAAADVFVGYGTEYSFLLTPIAPGVVGVDIPACAATDAAGNCSEAAQFSITYEVQPPSVAILGRTTDPTNQALIVVEVQFNKSVAGFEAGDMVIGNGSVTEFTPVSGMNYVVSLQPAAPGVVTVDVPANVAVDSLGLGNSAAPQFTITSTRISVPAIELTVPDDGTDATTIVPNPAVRGTPTFAIVAGGTPDVSIHPTTGEFAYAFAPGAAPGTREVTLEISSGNMLYRQLVRVTVEATPPPPTTPAPSPTTPSPSPTTPAPSPTGPAPEVTAPAPTPPPPPPVPLCAAHNFDAGGTVRSSLSDANGSAVNCRVLYQNGHATTWLGSDLYSAGSLGVEGIMELGVQQAIDIFSPGGVAVFEAGAVFCLRGPGTLIWLAASGSPRHAEIIGSYTVPEFSGFTCATLFEPGTLILVSQNPIP
jgi:hypothetical protein